MEMYDVEMIGKLGHTCHVFVMAKNREDAENLASLRFPELGCTRNTSGFIEALRDVFSTGGNS